MKKPSIIEKKERKIQPYEVNEIVLYHARGEEPKQGIIINKTHWKGEEVYEIEFQDKTTKWGSMAQLRRKVNKKEDNENKGSAA